MAYNKALNFKFGGWWLWILTNHWENPAFIYLLSVYGAKRFSWMR